jgi:uncharacterized protein YutE (UPF0331/DUF86 family)
VEDEVLVERLTVLRHEIAYLKQERDALKSFQDYGENSRLQRAVERALQVSVEACLDVGRRIISENQFRFPEDNKDVFQILAEEQVIPRALLPALLDMARFRNLMVHDYTRIDDAKVFAILKRNLGDFDAYALAIVEYLQRGASGPQ